MAENKMLNGFNLEAYKEGVAVARERAGATHAPKSCRIEWVRGVVFKTHIRQHTFVVDEPKRLGGEDTHPNSMEYVLGAYGACLAAGFVMNASKKSVEIHELEVTLDSRQQNAFTFLGIDSNGHAGFDQIRAKLKVRAEANEDEIRAIWEHTIRASPVHATLSESVRLEPEVEVTR